MTVKWTIPERGRKFAALFANAERQYGLPSNLLARMAQQESSFLDDIISGIRKSAAGAVGIMQIVPRWHPEIGEEGAKRPEIAIPYAAKYMRQLYNQFGDWRKALAAYNWGPGNLQKHIQKHGANWLTALVQETNNPNWETFNYVTKITQDVPV